MEPKREWKAVLYDTKTGEPRVWVSTGLPWSVDVRACPNRRPERFGYRGVPWSMFRHGDHESPQEAMAAAEEAIEKYVRKIYETVFPDHQEENEAPAGVCEPFRGFSSYTVGLWALMTVHKMTRVRIGHDGGACSFPALVNNIGLQMMALVKADSEGRARLLGTLEMDADQLDRFLHQAVEDLMPTDDEGPKPYYQQAPVNMQALRYMVQWANLTGSVVEGGTTSDIALRMIASQLHDLLPPTDFVRSKD